MTVVDPIVRLGGVSKSYGNFKAIDRIDLDIVPGEFITFLGPSGSGKTTTLMMLAGFETPTEGAIEMDGRRIERLPAHKRNIGVVFQNYALFPHMTVRENLAFPLSVRRVPASEIKLRVESALAIVHLEGLGERRPAQLSGGQQQRVALARAIIFKPRLIVLDEPLGALDKNLREHLQVELKSLHRDLGTTMVFVTHDQAEALTLSDRIAVFNKGRIEQLDTPERLYEKPRTPFVASFIGENNMVAGRVERSDAHHVSVRCAGGGLLTAAAEPWCTKGGEVTVSIRPENIKIAHAHAEQRLTATVVEVVYLGDQRRIFVDAGGLGRLILKTEATHAEPVAVGTRIELELSAGACRVLPKQ